MNSTKVVDMPAIVIPKSHVETILSWFDELYEPIESDMIVYQNIMNQIKGGKTNAR